jgi:hypothetical protein
MSDLFTKYRTFIAIAGLVGLALNQFSEQRYDAAVTSIVAAIGLFMEAIRPD